MGIWLITIFGLLLRLLFINKAEGLWNDEYISWYVASQPFTNGFFENVKAQCHMPFYYLYLKFFMTLFGQSDLLLRLTSVIAGTISIPVMYLTGREINKNTGVISALISALSAFLIYYSQEVRLYSILFLFSALSVLFTIKLVKKQNPKNFLGVILADFMIIATHTIGFVYVFFNILIISILLFKTYKKYIIRLWIIITFIILCSSPLIIKIFTTESFSQWWGHFSIAKYGFLLTDYFSPILTNLVDSPAKFFYNPTPEFFIFGLLPTLIAIFWIIKAVIKKEKTNLYLLLSAIGVIIIMTIAAILGKLVFITKYSIEIYPTLILLAAYGAVSINKKIIRYGLISIFCILHIIYLIYSPIAAPKIKRAQGHAIVADLINKSNLKDGDIIILEYYPQSRFEKYVNFSKYKVLSIDKGNFHYYMTPNTDYSRAYKEGKKIYRELFASNTNPYLKFRLYNDVIKDMKPNQNVLVIMLNSVAFYPSNVMIGMASDDALYEKVPLLFLVFSHIKSQIFFDLSENLARINFRSRGDWAAIKFTKLNNSIQE